MKILYITTSTEMGGAEKVLERLALQTAVNHCVQIISLRPIGEIGAILQQKGIEVKSLNLKKVSWPGKIIKNLQHSINAFQPDLIHAFLYWGIESARLACMGKNFPLICTPHFDFSKRKFYQKILDFLLKDKDQLTIAESVSTANYLIKTLKYNKNKVYLLPNQVASSAFYPDKQLRKQMRRAHHYHENDLVIMQVSRLEPIKNPLVLLKAFRNLVRNYPQARLVYVGEGSERTKIENFIQEGKLENFVKLVGMQENINAWLNMADIFVLPSLEESLPLALLEAMRVGLPCIVSHAGDMPLWVSHGENGFVFNPQDITILSCFLTELCLQPDIRRTQGEKSLKKMHSQQDTFPQYQQLYNKIQNGEFSRENTKC